MSKFYAVKKGRQTGIFLSWEECEAQVKGYKGALYKSFSSRASALAYLDQKPITDETLGLIAYVDGSFHVKTGEYGYGCVLLEGQHIVKQLYGKGHDEEYSSMRNVAGEIIGSEVAVRYAQEHGYHKLCLYYDYEGIEKWATGQWKAKKLGTQAYQKFMTEIQQTIQITFVKVLAHSGDKYNDLADALAKKAVGIS